ncbi:hypothetical protein KZZ07_19925 [Mameliella sp. CS4]|uniref:hypothetical protein n=1 Tax=Mameliella sp. CS4 TaxID=2862329 RepID=UPI001C6065D3|nr:hypothetical protein [Mameliella sp. CS4]MBW4984814.1 hypothetical protein [Mameliella sp. CS4]
MPDEFVFKKPIPAVVDNGSGMFQPPAIDTFEDPLLGKSGPPVFQEGAFTPYAYLKIPDIAGESFTDEGFVPPAFEDPLLG